MKTSHQHQPATQLPFPNKRTLTALSAVLVISAALTGCESEAAAPAAGAPAAGQSGPAYELVVVQKYEKLHLVDNWARGLYDLCVVGARLENKPVQPYPSLPADHVQERTVYASDGTNYVQDRTTYMVDTDEAQVASGCLIKHAKLREIIRYSNGMQEVVHVDAKGERIEQPAVEAPHEPDHDLTDHTVRRTENGISLKCLPPDSVLIQSGLLSASCAVDAGGGKTLLDYAGKPVMASGRVTLSEKMFGTASVYVPVSLRLGSTSNALLKGPLP